MKFEYFSETGANLTRLGLNTSSIVVSGSAPIIINKNGREAVASVVGLQMNYDKFYEAFTNISKECPPGLECNYTCSSSVSDLHVHVVYF